jgi:hypothetical protein
MNRNRRNLVQMMVVSFVVIGLLIAAWPGVAQGERPPTVSRQTVNFKERFWSGDLPIYPDAVSVKTVRTAPQLPMAITADWTYLVYQSYRNGNWEIYLANDGKEFRLTNNPASDARPRLNLEATKIVFNSNRDGNYEIYSMNIDGSNVQRLTFNAASDSAPSWSPDGTKIAFMSNRTGKYEIYVMNADGSGQTRMTYLPLTDDVTPVWSPDGNQIAWVQEQGTYGAINVMNANGSGQRQILGGQPYLADVLWSPAEIRFAFDYIPSPSYFPASGIYLINLDGTGLRRAYDSGNMWVDYWAGSWSPDAANIMYSRVEYIVQNNQIYIGSAYIESNGADIWSSAPPRYTSSGLDINPDWQSADRYAPSSQVMPLPPWTKGTTVNLMWNGTDKGPSGLSSYDIQFREYIDGPAGIWTDFQINTTVTSANFTAPYDLFGYTYCFRSRARDNAGNLEDYPGGNSVLAGGCGDTQTTYYHSAASGDILDNRERPVAAASVQPSTPALNNGVSQHDGRFDLYFAANNVSTLSVAQSNFGPLPALADFSIDGTVMVPTFFLPPLDNQIGNSHFESGGLAVWNPIGDLAPTITSTAHTGHYAALLGGKVSTDTLTTGPWHSAIQQTINLSPTIVSGTLSLLYQIKEAEPLSDTLTAYVVGANDMLAFTLPVTATAWTHAWFDVSAWHEPTATVKLDLSVGAAGRIAGAVFDEITWGSAITGSHAVFLPLLRR